eukprot:ANDGO_08520.mRNA.1 hypothetical protein
MDLRIVLICSRTQKAMREQWSHTFSTLRRRTYHSEISVYEAVYAVVKHVFAMSLSRSAQIGSAIRSQTIMSSLLLFFKNFIETAEEDRLVTIPAANHKEVAWRLLTTAYENCFPQQLYSLSQFLVLFFNPQQETDPCRKFLTYFFRTRCFI